MTTDLAFSSVSHLARLLASRQVSAVEVFDVFAARIEALNPTLNALVRFDRGIGRAQARQADARLAKGERNPWLGIPFTAKDNLWVQGQICTQGSALFRDFVAPRDALAVARLREAGAVFLGHTNCSEFACKGVTTNPVYGATRNPWDLARTPGGSSGGAASAVAAGLCPVALATDAGGSTRRPAAHVGIMGLKPTAGRIAHPDGFAEPVFGNSVIGLMTRDVGDLRVLLARLDGACPSDPCAAPPGIARPAAPRRLRIGHSPRLGLGYAVDPDVSARTDQALQRLAEQGHQVVALDPQWPEGTSEAALMPLQWAGLAALHGERWRRDPWAIDPDIAVQIERGLSLSGVDVAHALYLRDALYRALMLYFDQVDVMATPTTAATAWPLEALGPTHIESRPASPRDHAVFTPIFNHTGMPALSVPCGLDAGGLPIGLQLVAPRFGEEHLLRLGETLQATCPPLRPPWPPAP